MRFVLIFIFCFAAGSIIPSLKGAPLEAAELSLTQPQEKTVLTCGICTRFVDLVFSELDSGATNEGVANAVGNLCETLNIYNYKVCEGTAAIAMPTIRFIYESSEFIQGNVCGIMLQAEDCALSDLETIEWTIKPSDVPKPPVSQPSSPPQGSPTIKVLHLADVHWDPEYLEGSLAVCSDPVCCRKSSGNVSDPAEAAGYWGDYRVCDSPWWTIENAVAQMAQKHSDAAYIVWTGDLVPHDVWSTDKDENIMINEQLLNLMKRYFPTTPLYATLGNHESQPVNTFAPPEITNPELSTSWLYDEADKQWAKWLPADVSSTVRYGGYYTTLVRPGLRIVSMNMNYCYTFNWWTLYNSQDPASGLVWLNDVLQKAEEAGEKVHILSHIPPGNGDCWFIFSREFNKIINRFESTVAAQFYGHTHKEEFKLFYDETDATRPTNVAFIGGSLTPYSDMNPGYRVYTVDGPRTDSTWAVLDFSTYVMNLTASNLVGAASEPVWFELYQATKEYGLTDLSPKSMDSFFQRMVNDPALFQLYYKNYYKGADAIVNEGCDNECRSKLLCYIVTTNIHEQSRCDAIAKKIYQHKEF